MLDSEHVLIDKICFYNIFITGISDFSALCKKEIITCRVNQKNSIVLRGAQPFSFLHIKKNDFFDDFQYGISPNGKVYSVLEVSVQNMALDAYGILTDCNLNCDSVKEVKRAVKRIQANLFDIYGLTADMSFVRIKSIELNRTVPLENGSFDTYRRPIMLMMHMFSGKLRLSHEAEHSFCPSPQSDKKMQTVERDSGKRGVRFKAYDKSAQLATENIPTVTTYLRFEVTLKSPSKVKEKLGTNFLEELDDHAIARYFDDLFKIYWEPEYQKWNLESKKYLQHILKEKYEAGSRTWTKDVMLAIYDNEQRTQIPKMLALDALIEELHVLPFRRPQDRYNAKQSFSKVCASITSIYQEGDDRRLQELIQKLFHAKVA